jgi:RimJ/RimL family protein N-acetyltransferase
MGGANVDAEGGRPIIGIADHVVGWIDWDVERSWLAPDEVNVGYYLFPDVRGHGYATRAVELLLCVLADETTYDVATLLIAYGNERSLAVARRAMFE